MKKRLLIIISLIIAICASAFSFMGCDLVTTDSEKDFNQVVATVNIGGEYEGDTEEILKKDMILAYMNYGYYYVQNGYGSSQVFSMILDNLINERILVQTAKVEVKKAEELNITNWSSKNFVTPNSTDDFKAQYNALDSINGMIKSYDEKEETFQDAFDVADRAVPTGATNYTEKLVYTEDLVDELKNELNSKKGSVPYNKVVKLLEVNELAGDIKDNDILTTYYFDYLLESCYESIIIQKYENLLLDNKIDTDNNAKTDFNYISLDALRKIFKDKYDAQVALYENDDEAYKTALSSATKDEPILYAKDGYGYVWNLLISATEEQTEAIGKIDKTNKTNEAIAEERRVILEETFDIVMKDQRSSWVYSGYDAIFTDSNPSDDENVGTLEFINDFSLSGGSTFDGKVKWLNKVVGDIEYFQEAENGKQVKYYYVENEENVYDETYVPQFAVTELNETKGINVITPKIIELLGGSFDSIDGNNVYKFNGTYDKDLINDLILAYSTDSGSINSFNGYIIKLNDKNSSWVSEFQRDGEILLDRANEYGEGSLIVTATDYGYHFMISNGLVKGYDKLDDYCLAVDGNVEGIDNLDSFFDDMISNWLDLDESIKGTYVYSLANKYLENIISTYETEIQRIKMNDGSVIKFESRYADLLG